ncbi:ATP-dependent DNA helicase RecQ [Oceanobacillus piezotolerans]|uniref:ATP-dependent DNA helicase RecQ n=1 Tax=Oceanobacillus piezotolerans TaxID=2448030 RepID=A0A498DI19_9BACI|nr:ATP-dependent DNA helicase RecQ [Oceanobacillus piezotolerans]RLL48179.1 ATP-dependent DNA helicase RecQ [Oceanobacillus piezotolerans]
MTIIDTLEQYLQNIFHYPEFREGQKEIIEDVLAGEDVLGILPTGSGKSICYQLPAMLLEGLTIVVSPLISLMMDQVKELKANNIRKVIALNSFLAWQEKKRILEKLNEYKLLYISPEQLQQRDVLEALKKIKVSLFVIDEAHCISQWGHEFRPDYLKLNRVIELLKHPRTLALSATATPKVQRDIILSLGKPDMKKHIYPMDKPNIALVIEKAANDQEKDKRLLTVLESYQVPTLIYFSSRSATESCVKLLLQHLPHLRIAYYHGGMDQMDRIHIQQQFMNNQLDIVCCTNAFGMGINKSNIRLVIHYHFPMQVESYIQEIGRAGRDGEFCISLVLFSPADVHIPVQMIKNELPNEKMIKEMFHYLYTLSLKDELLPTSEAEIENRLQLNEIQWRFLQYHLEKHGMIVDNHVIYNEYNWKQIYNEIINIVNERTTLKQTKLQEMVDWIQSESCYRNSLYQSFQSTIREPDSYCCSNCGFKISDLRVSKPMRYDNENWEVRLKSLLLGDPIETVKIMD